MTVLLRSLTALMAVLNALGSLWIAAIGLLITADVVGRAFFASPIFGVPEIVKISVVGIVWLQMAHTLRSGGHLRSNVILDRLPARGRHVADVLAFVLGATIFALVAYTAWAPMIESWEIGEFEGEYPVRVPTYPIRSLLVVGAALTAVQFAAMAGRSLLALLRGEEAAWSP